MCFVFSLKRLNKTELNSSEDQWTFHCRVTSKVKRPGWSVGIEQPGF